MSIDHFCALFTPYLIFLLGHRKKILHLERKPHLAHTILIKLLLGNRGNMLVNGQGFAKCAEAVYTMATHRLSAALEICPFQTCRLSLISLVFQASKQWTQYEFHTSSGDLWGVSSYGLLGYYRRNMPPATAWQQFPNDKYYCIGSSLWPHIYQHQHMRRAGKLSSL